MKLLAAEVAVLLGQPFLQSYVRKLEDAYLRSSDMLRIELSELEESGIFLTMGVRNFLEADYFSWYLNEWDKEFQDRLREEIPKLEATDTYTLIQLFELLVKLEKEERNRIWIRLLKNSFAPLFEERFNYVVANPPGFAGRNCHRTTGRGQRLSGNRTNWFPNSEDLVWVG